MRMLFISLLLTTLSLFSFGQDSTIAALKKLDAGKQYQEIIGQYAANPEALSAEALYYVGYAYYMKEDDNNCLKFMDLSIAKNDKDARPHFIRASTLNFMEQFDKAILSFKTAIALKPDAGPYYSGLADAYYNLHLYDSALENYKKATEQKDAPDRAFSMIAQVYMDLKQEDKAMDAMYYATTKLAKGSGGYQRAMFNIGQIEYLAGRYGKAETAFLHVISSDPADYHACAKLMQVYYHDKAYDKAQPYREKLYAAHKQGVLKDPLKDMFCFDQFKWKDKSVQVFERYEEGPSSRIFNKHIFYVLDSTGKLELSIQTEYSPISIEMGGPKYILCGTQGRTHLNYGIGFKDGYKYDDLKDAVMKVLEKTTKAAASVSVK